MGLGGDKLMTPEWYEYGDHGCYTIVVRKRILEEDENVLGVEECMARIMGLAKIQRVIRCKKVFKRTKDVPWLMSLWWVLWNCLEVLV